MSRLIVRVVLLAWLLGGTSFAAEDCRALIAVTLQMYRRPQGLRFVPGETVPYGGNTWFPGYSRLATVYLTLSPSDDIRAVAKRLAQGRAASEIEKKIHSSLARATDPIPLSDLLPEQVTYSSSFTADNPHLHLD